MLSMPKLLFHFHFMFYLLVIELLDDLLYSSYKLGKSEDSTTDLIPKSELLSNQTIFLIHDLPSVSTGNFCYFSFLFIVLHLQRSALGTKGISQYWSSCAGLHFTGSAMLCYSGLVFQGATICSDQGII